MWGDERTQAELERMLTAVAHFCREMKEGATPRWLSFLGTSGAGKTYLARKIWDWYRGSEMFAPKMLRGAGGMEEVQYPGQWCYWPEVARLLAGNAGYDLLHELSVEKFVVFDEVGADRDPSGHVKDCLARALCSRVGKWTIVTSNKTLAQVGADIDTRIASRMIRDGGVVVEVEALDYSIWKMNEERNA